ncbi:SLATT domain-containing protein, partial [Klebsiella pneumoniae]
GYLIIWSIVAIFFFKVLKVIASLY